jgi:hypothetical protein
METIIIGFGYKAKSGKDTAANAILSAYPGIDIRHYSFGRALKQEITDMCRRVGSMETLFNAWRERMPDWVVLDPDPDMTDPDCPYGKQRTFLQWYGTEYRRAQDHDYWVKRVLPQIKVDRPQVALITDVRFPNEGDGIHSIGGKLVKVTRLGYIDPKAGSIHASESAMDVYTGWDYFIEAESGKVPYVQAEACRIFCEITKAHGVNHG